MTPFGPFAGQDSLSGPFDLTRRGDYVHFLSENQGCWSCAYRVDGGADPAVYLFGDGPEPVKQSDSLERFLVTCLLQESVMAAPHLANQEDGILPEEALHAPVEPLWLEAVYASPNPTHDVALGRQDVKCNETRYCEPSPNFGPFQACGNAPDSRLV